MGTIRARAKAMKERIHLVAFVLLAVVVVTPIEVFLKYFPTKLPDNRDKE